MVLVGAVLFDRGHPRFWKFNFIILVYVVRVKSYVNSLFNPTGVPMWVSVLILLRNQLTSSPDEDQQYTERSKRRDPHLCDAIVRQTIKLSYLEITSQNSSMEAYTMRSNSSNNAGTAFCFIITICIQLF